MAADKIIITDKLRLDIIETRKSKGISSYELSERVGNGHSKYWLQNIENGKTQKITKKDLVSLYMIMDENDDEEEVTLDIEQILNQSIGDSRKEWYELVTISEDFLEIYNEDDLMDTLDELLEDKLIPKIRDTIFGMSTNQKQAAITAVQNLYYSLYKNSDLAYALLNIPIYGVEEMDAQEHDTAMNDLLAISAKYNDMVLKNNSLQTIKEWHKRDEYYKNIDKETIQTAFLNFKNILLEIQDASKIDNPDLHKLVYKFNRDVTFMIERGQPNVTKHYLKSFSIHNGKKFITHIQECWTWFCAMDRRYDIKDIYTAIPQNLLDSVYDYLNTVDEIRPRLD